VSCISELTSRCFPPCQKNAAISALTLLYHYISIRNFSLSFAQYKEKIKLYLFELQNYPKHTPVNGSSLFKQVISSLDTIWKYLSNFSISSFQIEVSNFQL
jgi:hypothetical protein